MRQNEGIAEPASPPLLRTRRGLMFTALPAIAVMAVLGAVLLIHYRDATVEDRRRDVRGLANAAALNARRYLEDQFAILAAVAANPDVREARVKAMRPYLVDVSRGGRFGYGVGFVNARGLSVVSTSLPPGTPPVDVSDREYFQAALAGRPAVSDVIISRVRNRPILAFSYPTTGLDGRRTGAIAGSLQLDRFGEGLQRLLYAPDADVTLVDAANNRIVGTEPVTGLSPAPEAWPLGRMRRTGTGILDDVDDHVLAYARVEGTAWLAVVDRPRGELIGPLDRALYAELGAIALLGLIGVLLTLATARRLDALDRRREGALAEQREIALSLQRSLLPALPSPPGLDIAADYAPAQGAMAVGGDWYDVVEMGEGLVALSVGDVAGHGLDAAATMGKLRSATRSEALHASGPVAALAHLDRFIGMLADRPLATVTYVVLDMESGEMRYAAAGHPPPLVLRADGTTELLEDGRSPLLGIGPGTPHRTGADTQLEAGDTLILYTDGLIERPESSIDAGIAALRERVAAVGHSPDRLVTELLASVEEPRRDDAAVLAVRFQPSSVAS